MILVSGRRLGDGGFALIAALMIFLILIALGMLVFSVNTQDIRVGSRTVGERKAFSAAESGVQVLVPTFNPASPSSSAVSNVVVDTTSSGDPNTKYTIAAPPGGWNPTSGPSAVPMAGYAIGGGETWGRQRFLAQVTGANSGYNSTVQINAGLGYGPVDISTIYG